MRKDSVFNIVAALVFAVTIISFGAYLFHLDKKVDHISRPVHLFSPHQIESLNLSKTDFPDTMPHDLNKFCYIFCQQPLFWLAKGEHSFVFVTKNGAHVVKFLPLRQRPKVLQQMALSSQLAYDLLRAETGLVYLHLNRTARIARGICLTDFYGQQHRICGDNTRFVVQLKASPLFPTLFELIKNGKIEEAKARIDQVIDLLQTIAEKKISDGGEVSSLNDVIGFTPERAIFVDTWEFFKAPYIDVKARMQYELGVRLNPLKKWLDIVSPELAEYYRCKRDAYLGVQSGHTQTT